MGGGLKGVVNARTKVSEIKEDKKNTDIHQGGSKNEKQVKLREKFSAGL